MKTYLVGGAVRDMILGLENKDRDWVIVGATSEDIVNLQAQGYKQVGADFPVFLHPETGEEYALARTERKTGAGYLGFECNTDPSVTLEEDLYRRDITINAIAYDPETNTFIDPYSGVDHIKRRIISRVSDAYSEDPLRVLRTARFAARFNFNVDAHTTSLMQQIASNGELQHLSVERVYTEMKKAVEQAVFPSKIIRIMQDCGAWKSLFPSFIIYYDDLYHIIDKAVKDAPLELKFQRFMALVASCCNVDQYYKVHTQYKLPSNIFKFIKTSILYRNTLSKLKKLDATGVVRLFDDINASRQGLEQLLEVLEISTFQGENTVQNTVLLIDYYNQYCSTDLSSVAKFARECPKNIAETAIKAHVFCLKVQHMEEYIINKNVIM